MEVNASIILESFNKIINILGLKYDNKEKNQNIEKYINSIINLRSMIKNIINDTKDKEIKKKLFEITDYIRDIELPNLGVKLEDKKEISKWFFI